MQPGSPELASPTQGEAVTLAILCSLQCCPAGSSPSWVFLLRRCPPSMGTWAFSAYPERRQGTGESSEFCPMSTSCISLISIYCEPGSSSPLPRQPCVLLSPPLGMEEGSDGSTNPGSSPTLQSTPGWELGPRSSMSGCWREIAGTVSLQSWCSQGQSRGSVK